MVNNGMLFCVTDNIRHQYEVALAPPIPSPPPTPQPKRTKADWERDQREKAEEIENRRILKAREVPPYFQSELGKAFLLTQVNSESCSDT